MRYKGVEVRFSEANIIRNSDGANDFVVKSRRMVYEAKSPYGSAYAKTAGEAVKMVEALIDEAL